MKRYRVTFERWQRGKKLDWKEVVEVDCFPAPKVGESFNLLVDPPITQKVTKVEEIE